MMSPLLLCCLSLASTLASSLPRLTITQQPAPLTSAPATLRSYLLVLYVCLFNRYPLSTLTIAGNNVINV